MKTTLMVLVMMLLTVIPIHAYDLSEAIYRGQKDAENKAFLNSHPSPEQIEQRETQDKLDEIEHRLDSIE